MTNKSAPKKPRPKKTVNKELILRALTDPKFRRELKESPEKALGKKPSSINAQELKFVLAAVKAIESQIAALADELLCANGGPCGIA